MIVFAALTVIVRGCDRTLFGLSDLGSVAKSDDRSPRQIEERLCLRLRLLGEDKAVS